MKATFKRLVAIFLSGIFSFSIMSVSVWANQTQISENKKVVFQEDEPLFSMNYLVNEKERRTVPDIYATSAVIQKLSEEDLRQTVNDAVDDSIPGGGDIIIWDVSFGEEQAASAQQYDLEIPSTRAMPYYSDIKKRHQNSEVGKISFITSVAKGATITLSTTWTDSLAASVVGKLTVFDLDLKFSVSKTYHTTFTFNGPPENSQYNSRIYKEKFYHNIGTWTAIEHSGFSGSAGMMTREVSGKYTEPTHTIMTSQDIYG